MFEVETSTRMICSEKNCEVLIMTGENEYLELMGSTDDYEDLNFDWFNPSKAHKSTLPPMLCY